MIRETLTHSRLGERVTPAGHGVGPVRLYQFSSQILLLEEFYLHNIPVGWDVQVAVVGAHEDGHG